MASQPIPRLTPQDYLAIDRAAEYRSEYINGEMFQMAGASREHILIVSNINGEVRSQLRGSSCETYTNDMRVRISLSRYVYPDVVIACNPEFADEQFDILTNPRLIIEVLSPSTARDDQGWKFQSYRRSDTLQDDIMLAQDRPFAEHYSRYEQDLWTLREAEGLDDMLSLPSIGCELSLADIYERVAFPETPTD